MNYKSEIMSGNKTEQHINWWNLYNDNEAEQKSLNPKSEFPGNSNETQQNTDIHVHVDEHYNNLQKD